MVLDLDQPHQDLFKIYSNDELNNIQEYNILKKCKKSTEEHDFIDDVYCLLNQKSAIEGNFIECHSYDVWFSLRSESEKIQHQKHYELTPRCADFAIKT
nr:11872_t:CDS:2 [Entrophospora candida]